MLKTLTILVLTFSSCCCLAQDRQVDSLISELNNQQIELGMHYVWYPIMNSLAGDSLIRIGKPATEKLTSLLSDTSKGIIAHFILANIWWKELDSAGQKSRSRVQLIERSGYSILSILYTDFLFYREMDKDYNFSNAADLDKNKERWLMFFRSGQFRQETPIGSD